ncbi:MAG TPA: hypothetical protein VLH13_04685 [Methanomassiliicoccales archaeon]|nr:hypothetical protein [Methanomassiliicoccales archaeon]
MAEEIRADEEIDDLQQYALKELGNVGASYALAALSNLAHKPISVESTECKLEPIRSMPPQFGRTGDKFAVITIDVNSAQLSRIIFLMPKDVGTYVSDMIFGRPYGPRADFTDEDKEALIEMGDICIREYFSPIIRFLNIDIMPNAPNIELGEVGPHGSIPGFLHDMQSGYRARIETNFIDADKHYQGMVCFLPDKETQSLAFRKFGVDYESQAETFKKFGL